MDNKHDLKVDTDAREDGTKNSCCGKASNSCNPNKNEQSKANGLQTSSSNSKKVDFNEWAGTWPVCKPSVVCVLKTS